tara:strand:- start:4837 stop:6027 length:1191 start_codon:yes stop_codon:yes gene_type:complete
MAYYFIFPETDATIYSHPDRKNMNTGGDELLELVKEPGSTDSLHYPSRILIKFKNDDIKKVISIMGDDVFTSSIDVSSVNLQLSTADTKNLTSNHIIAAYAVSQSWDQGTGKYLNLPLGSNGVSWEHRDSSTLATHWTGSGTPTNWFGSAATAHGYGTGSIASASLTQGGGTWYTGSSFFNTQQFLEGDSLDTNIDVKNVIHKFSASLNVGQGFPNGIINNGFLLKTLDSVESNPSMSFGEIQYFSSNTHTIYPPKLCFKWDDSIHNKQSISKKSGELSVSLYGNKKEYNQNDEVKFRIHVRDKYPDRSFSTTSNYLDIGHLTTGSYYSIRDAHTEREVIPFDDNFTKLSADDEGMYFNLYMNGLQPERYYRILFKHINNDGTTIYDDKYYFKVVR